MLDKCPALCYTIITKGKEKEKIKMMRYTQIVRYVKAEMSENRQTFYVQGKDLNKAPVWLIAELENHPRVVIIGKYKSEAERKADAERKAKLAELKALERKVAEMKKELKG